jgi:hypothetical protein
MNIRLQKELPCRKRNRISQPNRLKNRNSPFRGPAAPTLPPWPSPAFRSRRWPGRSPLYPSDHKSPGYFHAKNGRVKVQSQLVYARRRLRAVTVIKLPTIRSPRPLPNSTATGEPVNGNTVGPSVRPPDIGRLCFTPFTCEQKWLAWEGTHCWGGWQALSSVGHVQLLVPSQFGGGEQSLPVQG